MTRIFMKLALGISLAILASPSDVFARHGGGRGGGQRGGGGRAGMAGGGAPMGRSPAFSQPSSSMTGRGPRVTRGMPTAGSRAIRRCRSRRGYANRNQDAHPNAGAAAAGAGYANRNQDAHPNAGAAAAGAGYANRNQSANHPNAGAAAAGAGYANRNQHPYSNAGAAAAGAGYANRNQYDQYHPGMTNGYWNGNYGAWGLGMGMGMGLGMGMGGYGGVGAWGMGSPMYGYGYSAYGNPYAGGMVGAGGGQLAAQGQPVGAGGYDYSQPLNTAAAPPESTATDQATAVFNQARDAFKSNDYAAALQLDQQALGQMPNDATLHEFLALVFFAQGKYEQAAAPLYAILSVAPGWDWTTLIGNYADANLYTEQLRGLEAYVKANPKSAAARFVLAYHYITQGHGDAAAGQLKEVVALQPSDTLSAQLLAKLEPASTTAAAPQPLHNRSRSTRPS